MRWGFAMAVGLALAAVVACDEPTASIEVACGNACSCAPDPFQEHACNRDCVSTFEAFELPQACLDCVAAATCEELAQNGCDFECNAFNASEELP